MRKGLLCRYIKDAEKCPFGGECKFSLRREKFDAVCQNGNAAIVVFPPWHEVGGIVLARNCEQDPTTETAVDASALMEPTRPAAQASPTSPLGSAGGWQPT